MPPNAGRCAPLGGDCFDFLPLGDGRVALAIADASGKGLAAALVIAKVQSSLRTAAWFAPDDAAAVVHAVNRQLHASSPADRYATLFYGVFDEATHRLEYVNAGHNPPLLIRGGNSLMRLETGGPPVGIFADSVYSAGIVQRNAGDLIVAYTDGVVEARDTAGEEWEVQGLFAAASGARRQPDRILEAALAALDEFSSNGQRDDRTILVASVH